MSVRQDGSACAIIDKNYEVPFEIDRNNHLAGMMEPKLIEVEIYQLI